MYNITFYGFKVASGPESPGDFLKKLNRHDFEPGELLQTLQALRVNLTGKPLRYSKVQYKLYTLFKLLILLSS